MIEFEKFSVKSINPLVAVHDQFLSAEELKSLQAHVRTLEYEPSAIQKLTPDRKSYEAVVDHARTAQQAKPIPDWVERYGTVAAKVCNLLNLPVSATEIPIVLKYEVGEEYQQHFDTPTQDPNILNHRIFTALLYLNDNFEGGTTQFPLLNLEITPKPGRLLVWSNLRLGLCTPHPLSAHKGTMVTSGCKYIMTFWLHVAEWNKERLTLPGSNQSQPTL